MAEENFRPTELQIRILEQLLLGTTDVAIGRHLKIADRTVRLHISRLQNGLNVQGRFALGAAAHARGWIRVAVPPVIPEQRISSENRLSLVDRRFPQAA